MKHDECAVVIVDMQDRFIRGLDKHVGQRLLAAQLELIILCKTLSVPVVVTEYCGQGRTHRLLRDALRTHSSVKYMEKIANGAFYHVTFERYIRSLNVKRLVFAGINASFCVYATAKGALRRGYTIASHKRLLANQRLGRLGNASFVRYQSGPWYAKNGLFLRDEPMPLLFE